MRIASPPPSPAPPSLSPSSTSSSLSASSSIQTIKVAKRLTMSGDQGASVYQLEEASRALATLCNSISAEAEEDSMTSEQQAKRRRTESRATDAESPAAAEVSPTTKPSPSATRRTPSVANLLPAIRSPAVTPALQPMLHQAQQQHYYQDPASQYPYHPAQNASQSHLSAHVSSATSPAFSTPSGITQPHQRLFSSISHHAANQYNNQHYPPPAHQQLGLPAHPAVSMTQSAAAATSMSHTQLHQQFVSPHTIPSSLLGHSTAVGNTDYGVWLYPQQQIHPASADRSVALASVGGGVANSTSTSPISQHALAPADNSYPFQGQLDGQMRYMAVPGQTSGIPKPITPASFSIDRSLRPITISGHQPNQQSSAQSQAQGANYHGLSTIHQYNTHQQQAHSHHQSFSHPQTQQPQYHQQHQHDYSTYYQTHQPIHPTQQVDAAAHQHALNQQSAFPTQPSTATAVAAAAAAAAALSEGSSGQLPPMAASSSNSGSVLHHASYGTVHGGHQGQLSPEQVSAAQMAAAVAAAAASAHTIPASAASSSSSMNVTNGGAPSSGTIGISGGRLGVGMNDIDQHGLSSFKFSMNMASGSESGLPEYFENYTQNYMLGGGPGPAILEPSPSSPTEPTLDSDLLARLDDLFMKYLEAICSNTITVDSEGESIHQTQMAKKLEKLEQCTEYRTFRFRIQAFSNGYREFIEREAGMTEQVVSKQQLRSYLHQQSYISRYNEDGKKAKSKGHHVWNVEAKKISRNTWWFKEFLRRIASPPPKAIIGVPYEWTPTIWDPQVKSPKVYFNSEWLPSWLRWENNTLRGLPPVDATDCNIVVIASYYQGKELCHLKTNFTIHVLQHPPTSTTVFMS
ncbi:hypothetical protein EDC05_006183 [Coemansia umbellata]|uniref:Uncharacterized protein n=1 Tax=Coemansia umbellata TaxID=1424467 RepID=A0ABQ8PDH7_9FUNG|nr:hypothetical protein EDC05_006183 [Coemansia umbellata]